MKKDKKYEFGLESKSEQFKIIAARVLVFSVMLASLLSVITGSDSDVSSRFYTAGLFAVGIFFYINLLKIKLEFSEILESTFGHQGVEFAILGGVLSSYATYLKYFS